ncbi:MAG: biopolymer transporter ExbD [Burkholderiaceae bacterium]|jgi:biopolymer transport protein ExbD/biopolymer transport protein TolR|nr:biopolymer transporter ExbD [Aquabacterium sp.]NUP87527.1 biopolymer transporter ExbD [Burkholderiaceae bacterium]
MAFGRLERRAGAEPMSDINMTPLIDVMLVLLVIFMITAPLMTSSLKLDLPKAAGAKPTDAGLVVTVAVDPLGQLYWGDEAVDAAQLKLRVREAALRSAATEVQLRADKTVSYGRIAELIGLVQEGGLTRIGFVTETGAPAAN